jgi:hypothetical protein
MRYILLAASALFMSAGAAAAQPVAREVASESRSRSTVAFDVASARAGTRFEMPLPNGRSARLLVEKIHRRGSSTVIQAHADGEVVSTSTLSFFGAAAFGAVRAGGRAYQVDTGADGVTRVTDLAESGLREAPSGPDTVLPPPVPADATPNEAAQKKSPDTANAIPAGNAIVDIGMFYTPSMATRYGLSLGGRMTSLVDQLNTSLANSNVSISYVVGYIGPIAYSESAPPSSFLSDIKGGSVNANGDLSSVLTIRNAKGLDLISGFRAFDKTAHDSCGTAYQLGQSNTIPASLASFGFSVASDGNDVNGQGFFCDITTAAHEIGHNMGLAHNREDATGPGVFSYSYGYRVPGSFRTIMAYASSQTESRVRYFSDPGISSCQGQPCGKPIGDSEEANNAQSLRNVGANVAMFRARTSEIYAATLPGSRSVKIGTTATAFASIINDSDTVAHGCGVTIHGAPAGSFSYQTTSSATNQLIGSPNTPIDIPARGVQTFLFALNATASFSPSEIPVGFFCDDRRSATSVTGLNTLFYSATSINAPDVIALVDTLGHDGVATIPGVGQTTAFVVAASNVGSAGNVTATVDVGGAAVPATFTICQTNTSTGACLSPAATSVSLMIGAGNTASFSVFPTATGDIPFDPAGTRAFVRFRDQIGSTLRGSTSVALRTP